MDKKLNWKRTIGRNNKMNEEKCKICGNQLVYMDEKSANVCQNPGCPR